MNEQRSHTESRSMDAATLDALRGSIAKWERIVAGTDIDRGCENCPLCMMFNTHWLDRDSYGTAQCAGCPVAEAVGEHGCEGTPYMEGRFVRTQRDGRESYQPTKETAEAELAFLMSLLPEVPLSDEHHLASGDQA
jgi:hypothetical protein